MNARFGMVVMLCLLGAGAFAQSAPLTVSGKPTWYTVRGAQPVTVVSAENLQPIGQLMPEQKFLSFGATDEYITLGFNGLISYIPRQAAAEVYPVQRTQTQWRGAGKSLEEVVEERERENAAARSRGEPLYKPKAPTPGPDGQIPGQAPGGQPGIDPYGAQGAAGGKGYV